MSKPSWLEPTNHLETISRPLSNFIPASPCPPHMDVQKVRCLWLISFIQDMRTFMGYSYGCKLSFYPSINAAVGLLRYNFLCSIATTSRTSSDITLLEYDTLACLLSFSVMVQESIPTFHDVTIDTPAACDVLFRLDMSLRVSHDLWTNSVSIMRSVIYQYINGLYGGNCSTVNYIVELADVLAALSLEARRGVEKCLLNLLCRLGNTRDIFPIDEGWTPDSLLSSIHGN